LINQVDTVICQGESWKTFFFELSNKRSSEKFVVIPNWLDTGIYVQNRTGYSTDSSNRNLKILFLGWIEETKGIFDLLAAIQMIKANLTDQQFLIAGQGSAKAEAERKAADLQIDRYVKFIGWADGKEKMNLLRQADLYVFPSHFEGYPNSLLEAMASEVPVIATRVGAVPEVIQDQINGLLVDIRDTKALAAALQKMIQDSQERETLGKKAREFVLRNNSVENAVNRFKEVLI
jgi:glycosyltransferase involved in cell wall biosynthesis